MTYFSLMKIVIVNFLFASISCRVIHFHRRKSEKMPHYNYTLVLSRTHYYIAGIRRIAHPKNAQRYRKSMIFNLDVGFNSRSSNEISQTQNCIKRPKDWDILYAKRFFFSFDIKLNQKHNQKTTLPFCEPETETTTSVNNPKCRNPTDENHDFSELLDERNLPFCSTTIEDTTSNIEPVTEEEIAISPGSAVPAVVESTTAISSFPIIKTTASKIVNTQNLKSTIRTTSPPNKKTISNSGKNSPPTVKITNTTMTTSSRAMPTTVANGMTTAHYTLPLETNKTNPNQPHITATTIMPSKIPLNPTLTQKPSSKPSSIPPASERTTSKPSVSPHATPKSSTTLLSRPFATQTPTIKPTTKPSAIKSPSTPAVTQALTTTPSSRPPVTQISTTKPPSRPAVTQTPTTKSSPRQSSTPTPATKPSPRTTVTQTPTTKSSSRQTSTPTPATKFPSRPPAIQNTATKQPATKKITFVSTSPVMPIKQTITNANKKTTPVFITNSTPSSTLKQKITTNENKTHPTSAKQDFIKTTTVVPTKKITSKQILTTKMINKTQSGKPIPTKPQTDKTILVGTTKNITPRSTAASKTIINVTTRKTSTAAQIKQTTKSNITPKITTHHNTLKISASTHGNHKITSIPTYSTPVNYKTTPIFNSTTIKNIIEEKQSAGRTAEIKRTTLAHNVELPKNKTALSAITTKATVNVEVNPTLSSKNLTKTPSDQQHQSATTITSKQKTTINSLKIPNQNVTTSKAMKRADLVTRIPISKTPENVPNKNSRTTTAKWIIQTTPLTIVPVHKTSNFTHLSQENHLISQNVYKNTTHIPTNKETKQNTTESARIKSSLKPTNFLTITTSPMPTMLKSVNQKTTKTQPLTISTIKSTIKTPTVLTKTPTLKTVKQSNNPGTTTTTIPFTISTLKHINKTNIIPTKPATLKTVKQTTIPFKLSTINHINTTTIISSTSTFKIIKQRNNTGTIKTTIPINLSTIKHINKTTIMSTTPATNKTVKQPNSLGSTRRATSFMTSTIKPTLKTPIILTTKWLKTANETNGSGSTITTSPIWNIKKQSHSSRTTSKTPTLASKTFKPVNHSALTLTTSKKQIVSSGTAGKNNLFLTTTVKPLATNVAMNKESFSTRAPSNITTPYTFPKASTRLPANTNDTQIKTARSLLAPTSMKTNTLKPMAHARKAIKRKHFRSNRRKHWKRLKLFSRKRE